MIYGNLKFKDLYQIMLITSFKVIFKQLQRSILALKILIIDLKSMLITI